MTDDISRIEAKLDEVLYLLRGIADATGLVAGRQCASCNGWEPDGHSEDCPTARSRSRMLARVRS
jgi:hypothetical protein